MGNIIQALGTHTPQSATVLQLTNTCPVNAIGYVDYLIYLFVIVSPFATVTIFGLARLSDNNLPHSRWFHYLVMAESVLIRVSVVLFAIGVVAYFFVGHVGPEALQTCSRF